MRLASLNVAEEYSRISEHFIAFQVDPAVKRDPGEL